MSPPASFLCSVFSLLLWLFYFPPPVKCRPCLFLLTPTSCYVKSKQSKQKKSAEFCSRLANQKPELAVLASSISCQDLSVSRLNPSGLLSLHHCNIICIFWFSMPTSTPSSWLQQIMNMDTSGPLWKASKLRPFSPVSAAPDGSPRERRSEHLKLQQRNADLLLSVR